MALAWAFVKLAQLDEAAAEAGQPSLADALVRQGPNITVYDRPVITEDILDPETEEKIGEYRYPQQELIESTAPQLWGGLSIIATVGQWSAVIMVSTEQRILAIDSNAEAIGNVMILMAIGVKDEEFGSGYNWDGTYTEEDQLFINGKLEDANLPIDPIAEDETQRAAVRRIVRAFVPDFELEDWGLLDLEM